MRWFHLTWFAIGTVALLLVGCFARHEPTSPLQKAEPPVVRVVEASLHEVVDYAYLTGRIEAPEAVKIQARVTGYLNSVDFTPGTEVKSGQQLFLIDPRPYQAELDRALGRVRLTEAHLKLAIADYDRAVEIAKTPGGNQPTRGG